MREKTKKIMLVFFAGCTLFQAQVKNADDWLNTGGFKMTFPSIYFKHNSTDYATMSYTVDSCFKYIALHFKDNINCLVIWRDSLEAEELTNQRIKKLKLQLHKYTSCNRVDVYSMGEEQKISRRTINKCVDPARIEYLLSFNSVLDISKTRFPSKRKWSIKSHVDLPRPWCLACWRSGFHIKERRWRRSVKHNKKVLKTSKH
jgi:hypothetical protein